jgi:hypothetical protein
MKLLSLFHLKLKRSKFKLVLVKFIVFKVYDVGEESNEIK